MEGKKKWTKKTEEGTRDRNKRCKKRKGSIMSEI
jgi:hypothetical protein